MRCTAPTTVPIWLRWCRQAPRHARASLPKTTPLHNSAQGLPAIQVALGGLPPMVAEGRATRPAVGIRQQLKGYAHCAHPLARWCRRHEDTFRHHSRCRGANPDQARQCRVSLQPIPLAPEVLSDPGNNPAASRNAEGRQHPDDGSTKDSRGAARIQTRQLSIASASKPCDSRISGCKAMQCCIG